MIVYSDFNKARFGNQLFFVSATIGIAIKNNTTYGFSSQLGYNGINYQYIFEKNLPLLDSIPNTKFYQNNFAYEDVKLQDAEIIGYFQSEKFFTHCEDIIRDQFQFKSEIIKTVIKKYPEIKNSLTIHVRRSDYLEQPNHHPVVPLNYYEKILSQISQNYKNIFVFSDDENWVKNNFTNEKFIFPSFQDNNDLYSFVLMSLGKDNIIANSSYSWWAAWLNKDENKKIYCPSHKQWFGPSYSNLDTKDLLPDKWNQIDY